MNRTKPADAINGPTLSGTRGPNRVIRPPDQRKSTNINRIKGNKTAPAAVAEYLCTWIRFSGRKKRIPPRAAYKNNVRRLPAVKVLERNKDNGTMGEADRASTRTKAINETMPSTAAS